MRSNYRKFLHSHDVSHWFLSIFNPVTGSPTQPSGNLFLSFQNPFQLQTFTGTSFKGVIQRGYVKNIYLLWLAEYQCKGVVKLNLMVKTVQVKMVEFEKTIFNLNCGHQNNSLCVPFKTWFLDGLSVERTSP